MLYISELCEDCAVANAYEIDYEIDDAWTNIHGIHDNGPRDHGRVTSASLTAYGPIANVEHFWRRSSNMYFQV